MQSEENSNPFSGNVIRRKSSRMPNEEFVKKNGTRAAKLLFGA